VFEQGNCSNRDISIIGCTVDTKYEMSDQNRKSETTLSHLSNI
jgi:hypothetical protein